MKLMNLPAIRHRRNKQIAREQGAIRNSIYNNLIDTNSNNIFYTIVEEILDNTDSNLFGTWDTEINSYM